MKSGIDFPRRRERKGEQIMREILFRGKRVDNGEWIEGFYSPIRLPIVGEMGHFINEDGYRAIEIKKETVCEYTGLTDKNGKRIFEGDLFVPYTYGEKDNDFAGVIEKRGASFVLRSKNYADLRLDDCVEKIFSHYQPNVGEIFVPKNEVAQGEVIDNIHDNPELLEVKE